MLCKTCAVPIWPILFLLISDQVLPMCQQVIGVPYSLKDAFVLEFAPPHARLRVDVGDNLMSTLEALDLTVSEQTGFTDSKNRPMSRALLRPGMKVEIQAERVGSQIAAKTVRIKTNIDAWQVDVEGLFERLDGEQARVDGQTVKLAPGVRIDGDNEWKGKHFTSFSEMMLGSIVEVTGVRKPDGIVYVSKGKTRPNLFTELDKKLITSVKEGLVITPPNRATASRLKIGDSTELKIVGAAGINSYISGVGQKLIPLWVKNLPVDDPAKSDYRFFVIEDEEINACALPNGFVLVNTGLLKIVKNEAQLAAVLGHEIAHVTYEHSRKNIEASSKTRLLLDAYKMIRGNKDDVFALTFGAGVLSNKLGRNFEDQADRVGLFYMQSAGYDPREAPKIWREITKVVKESAISNFLYSDHSTARARLQNLNREIAYNYYGVDFAGATVGETAYRSVFVKYLGRSREAASKVTKPPSSQDSKSDSDAKSKQRMKLKKEARHP